MKYQKIALLLTPLLAFGLYLVHELATNAEAIFDNDAARVARLVLCLISAFASVAVLTVHWIFPPHPKFVLLRKRYVCIKLHVIAGTFEFVMALAAFWLNSPMLAQLMAGAALLIHVPTAIIQTPIVFGSRALMIPAYILCIALHGYCACQLWLHPDSNFWLVQTFLTFSIYAWVRLYYFVFKRLRLFDGWGYTASVLAAGVTIAPAVLGPAAILFLVTFVVLFLVLYWLIWDSTRAEILEYMTEHRRETYVSGKLRRRLDAVKSTATIPNQNENRTEQDAAYLAFATLDVDRDGFVTADELRAFLVEERVPEWLVNGLVELLKQPKFSREEFHERIWNFGAARKIGATEMESAVTADQKAKAVFDQIDLNGDGFINSFELGLLLMEWDLPPRDVELCLQKYAGTDGRISPDQFRERLKPIWRFAYSDVIARNLDRRTG